MLFAQYLKLGYAVIPPLAHDEHALLAARSVGKDEVIGGRENPLVSRLQTACKSTSLTSSRHRRAGAADREVRRRVIL